MSKYHKNKRATDKAMKTPIKKSRRTKREEGINIDPTKQNDAGFYEGMTGVFIDELGNRRIMELSLTPDADVLLRMGAHPVQMQQCMQSVMETSPMFKQMVLKTSKDFRRAQFIGRIRLKVHLWWNSIKKKLKPQRKPEEDSKDQEKKPMKVIK